MRFCKKTLTTFSIIAAFFLVIFPKRLFAASGWTACTPVQTSKTESVVRFLFANCTIYSDPSDGKGGWMTLDNVGSAQKRTLILSAISMNKPITIEFDTNQKDPDGFVYILSVVLSK